jgi:hypothetical protein
MRRLGATILILIAAHGSSVRGQTPAAVPLSLLDVPFISQTEALCGGAAAAMVLRFWGERDVSAESFAHLVDRSAAGIRTNALIDDLQRRGWGAAGIAGTEELLSQELARGRPVVALIEDRPDVYHYVVVVARHERGVIFHDPARIPFRVMPPGDFARRWNAAGRWMAVVVPGAAAVIAPPAPPVPSPAATSCDQLIADGVTAAGNNELGVAERLLTSAFSCPGSAAPRELAGVRLLQQRWSEVNALARVAVEQDPQDAYGWKLLGTARFIEDDPAGALSAWNHAGEPRLDAVRIDGLARTRHRVVERLLAAASGDVLTPATFVRAQRRLAALPSATSTRLEYRPAESGRADLRGAVVERPLVPTSPFSLLALGVSAAAQREIRLTLGSLTGGGEQPFVSWRFWDQRRRIAGGIRAPAPWGGVWSVEGFRERQGFTAATVPAVNRAGVQVTQTTWATARLRWDIGAGAETRRTAGDLARLNGGLRFVSMNDRLTAQVDATRWIAADSFAGGSAVLRLQSSTERQGIAWLASARVDAVSAAAPADLWPAGDTGVARSALLRAHPVLTGSGRLRIERLGRTVQSTSIEVQRWWRIAAPVRVAAAGFIDAARTAHRIDGSTRRDADAGVGARVSAPGLPGILRVDAAAGLKDGARVLSFVLVVE